MKLAFTRQQALLALIIGVAAGAVVATIMTALDWRLNPGGIFHNEQGANWNVVLETAFSWFWPVSLASFVVAALGLIVFWRAK